MIEIDGVCYQEKRNIDADLPPCSMCRIPLNKCTCQCQKFGNNYFFVNANPEDYAKDISGCLKGAAICGIVIAAVITLVLFLI